MGVFAQRPAPIQVNYLGFPGTLGAPYMDYILADRIVIPEDEQRFYDRAGGLSARTAIRSMTTRRADRGRNAQPRRSGPAGGRLSSSAISTRATS